ncbi:uncharacterized protein LOC142240181 [Haematobia irritans]|uniref:uncharacterized protein LOC142240181 n=1 Tax=Haematobia irritans TaxID=7368 RepID=UPI003F4FB4A2
MENSKTSRMVLVLIAYLLVDIGMGDINENIKSNELTRLQGDILKQMRNIKTLLNYEYIIIWRNKESTMSKIGCCFIDDFIQRIEYLPFMIFDNERSDGDEIMSTIHSKNAIMLSSWANGASVSTIKLTEVVLGHLIWVDNDMEAANVCHHFKDDIQLNKFIIGRSFISNDTLYTCNMTKLMTIDSSTIRKLHRYGIKDLQGSQIVTESDQLLPRSMLYYDKEGNLQLEGLMGNCVATFAKRYKATLFIIPPLKLGHTLYYQELVNKTSEGLLDISASLAPYENSTEKLRNVHYSYPLELLDLCFMIPLPRLMAANKIFMYIIDKYVIVVIPILVFAYGLLFTIATHRTAKGLSLVNILLNDKSIRVLLGQSFVMPRKPSLFMQYISFLFCYTSMIMYTTYEAYLQSNLIHPPLEQRVQTYNDMRKVGLKVATSVLGRDMIESSLYIEYRDLLVPQISYDAFMKLRDSMDTRYAYPVTHSRWKVFSEQQRLFRRKLFYYSENQCIRRQTLFGIPMQQKLPYKTLFDQHIMNLWETGFIQYWVENSFYTMVRLNYSKFEDLIVTTKIHKLDVLIYIVYFITTTTSMRAILFVLFITTVNYVKKSIALNL